jgi:hypothetical protein
MSRHEGEVEEVRRQSQLPVAPPPDWREIQTLAQQSHAKLDLELEANRCVCALPACLRDAWGHQGGRRRCGGVLSLVSGALGRAFGWRLEGRDGSGERPWWLWAGRASGS